MKMAMSAAAFSASTFSEQIGVVVDWFNSWNDCEKVVALYCLLRKLPPPQTKFLSQVLDQIVDSCSPIDLEEQANDPGWSHFLLIVVCSMSAERVHDQIISSS